ncbi:MAG UNVERIFIED_CONTAM: uracil-DNA glycosylase [Planctomycetaceae bacterium]
MGQLHRVPAAVSHFPRSAADAAPECACGNSWTGPVSRRPSGQRTGVCRRSPLPLPPSLRNIQRKLQQDLRLEHLPTLRLEHWAKQGVLLLNTVLTVRAHAANSHRGRGWEQLTQALLEAVNEQSPTAFILWGTPAARIAPGLHSRHFVLTSPHPSPLSAWRGFFGSRPFSRVNAFLLSQGQAAINWLEQSSQDG